jgi:hypothetical protein
MRWRLLLEEFGPKLLYIKGGDNIVADALSRMRLSEADFSPEAFAIDDDEFPKEYPLSYKELAHEQRRYPALQQKLNDKDPRYTIEEQKHSDATYRIANKDGKMVVPPSMQRKATEWYHQHLMHPGETRMELTIGQFYHWKGMRDTIQQICKACAICKTSKKRNDFKNGLLEPKVPEATPWHTLCIDLIGPYTIGPKKKETKLHALTMIDPATGWFEIAEIPTKRADDVVNILEFTWPTRYPWPTEIIMDRGKEFAAEVQRTIKHEYGSTKKLITTRNPRNAEHFLSSRLKLHQGT